MDYKPIPNELFKDKDKLTLVRRSETWAIYKRSAYPSFEHCNYEVIKIFKHDGKDFHGTWYEPSEFLASTGTWGQSGFTFQYLEDAENKFNKMTAKDWINS